VSQSPIFVKTEVFLKWLLEHTEKFPKHERFRLAKRIEDAAFAFHEHLIFASQSPKPKPLLRLADTELDKLRAYLRLSVELKYTSYTQYGFAAQQTTELGKLLGGWVKSVV